MCWPKFFNCLTVLAQGMKEKYDQKYQWNLKFVSSTGQRIRGTRLNGCPARCCTTPATAGSSSQEAIAEYRRRGCEFDGELGGEFDHILWYDPEMVGMVLDLGARANGVGANLLIASVPAPFEKHIRIDEYEGFESVRVHHHWWFIEHTRAVLRSRLSAQDKVGAIAALSAQQEEMELHEYD